MYWPVFGQEIEVQLVSDRVVGGKFEEFLFDDNGCPVMLKITGKTEGHELTFLVNWTEVECVGGVTSGGGVEGEDSSDSTGRDGPKVVEREA